MKNRDIEEKYPFWRRQRPPRQQTANDELVTEADAEDISAELDELSHGHMIEHFIGQD